ncbi:MAG: HNH endonuclease [Achromobacter sp.]|nr:HNH endonuclease [Achromobacter sp.]
MSSEDFTRLMTYVSEYLEYADETGSLIWKKVPPRSKSRISRGDIAGTLVKGYRRIKILGRIYSAHRIVWAMHHGEMPDGMLDHIDRNRSNDRISNLRMATTSENRRNSTVKSDNRLGIKGVRQNRYGRYEARIFANGKGYFLGSFAFLDDAIAARRHAALEIHGEFQCAG